MEKNLFSRMTKIKLLGASLGAAGIFFITGILFWGAFNTAMEATNTLEFCIGCHEMESTVYKEYKHTVHYENRSGVRAVCSDCHVPDPWIYKFIRKIKASKELYHWAMGSIDTQEEFEARRLTLAKNVWREMKMSDSRECRNCHSWDGMIANKQQKRAWKNHQLAQADNMTCIDCHKGIAHRDVSHLIAEGESFYDGKPVVGRQLDPISDEERDALDKAATEAAMHPAAAPQAAAPAAAPAAQPAAATPSAAPAAGDGPINWASIQGRDITLLYPGQA
ncbi:MAG: NapC/NirT family cytochrome c, partial [Rhodospirillales bacterium]|nr:NapC/NirT family cytochrome c [Rhodospirillales bacterium]